MLSSGNDSTPGSAPSTKKYGDSVLSASANTARAPALADSASTTATKILFDMPHAPQQWRCHSQPRVASRRCALPGDTVRLCGHALCSSACGALSSSRAATFARPHPMDDGRRSRRKSRRSRGLPLRHADPKGGRRSRRAARAARQDGGRGEDEGRDAAEGFALARWGIIPPGTDYLALMVDLMTEQIAGYYDPDTKKLTISQPPATIRSGPRWCSRTSSTTACRIRRSICKKFEDLPDGEGDAALARHALVEGDGIALMLEVMLARNRITSPWANPEIARRARSRHVGADRRRARQGAARDARGDAVSVSRRLRVRRGAAPPQAVDARSTPRSRGRRGRPSRSSIPSSTSPTRSRSR